jgi:hypothetical protein
VKLINIMLTLFRVPHQYWRMAQEESMLDNYGCIQAHFVKCLVLSTEKLRKLQKDEVTISEMGFTLDLSVWQMKIVEEFWGAFQENKE